QCFECWCSSSDYIHEIIRLSKFEKKVDRWSAFFVWIMMNLMKELGDKIEGVTRKQYSKTSSLNRG
ncbi:MAG: hypothetical protein NWS17_04860, partial [Flavobacteriales bacterium]|nr:hypothetical protein [Flavobacteriales bacterium]